MQMPDHKVVLGSPEWIAHADGVVRDILAEHGEEGQSLRICEVCVDAPPEIRNDDRNASWVIFRLFLDTRHARARVCLKTQRKRREMQP